jgi:dihydroneopterin aldolase/2-amino-4-hydroxy-6-hydroxymethyldihydropteridine diphosphokinase
MFKMEKIYLLLGTNQGARIRNLRAAQAELRRNQIKIIKKSSVYQTPPWGKEDQPDFLNQALQVDSSHPPVKLLRILKQIEKKMGRKKGSKWGPRLIDIDILFYDGRIVKSRNLKIPHPYFKHRSFAIVPMAELSPEFVDPRSARKMKDYLTEIDHEGIAVYRR